MKSWKVSLETTVSGLKEALSLSTCETTMESRLCQYLSVGLVSIISGLFGYHWGRTIPKRHCWKFCDIGVFES